MSRLGLPPDAVAPPTGPSGGVDVLGGVPQAASLSQGKYAVAAAMIEAESRRDITAENRQLAEAQMAVDNYHKELEYDFNTRALLSQNQMQEQTLQTKVDYNERMWGKQEKVLSRMNEQQLEESRRQFDAQTGVADKFMAGQRMQTLSGNFMSLAGTLLGYVQNEKTRELLEKEMSNGWKTNKYEYGRAMEDINGNMEALGETLRMGGAGAFDTASSSMKKLVPDLSIEGINKAVEEGKINPTQLVMLKKQADVIADGAVNYITRGNFSSEDKASLNWIIRKVNSKQLSEDYNLGFEPSYDLYVNLLANDQEAIEQVRVRSGLPDDKKGRKLAKNKLDSLLLVAQDYSRVAGVGEKAAELSRGLDLGYVNAEASPESRKTFMEANMMMQGKSSRDDDLQIEKAGVNPDETLNINGIIDTVKTMMQNTLTEMGSDNPYGTQFSGLLSPPTSAVE